MARGKTKSKSGESPFERVLGTALTGVVIAKLAFDHHGGEPQHDGDGGVRPGGAPTQMPKPSWPELLSRARLRIKEDAVPLLSGGVAFYGLLALFPALIALVSIYGLVASPAEVATQLQSITRAMPAEARQLLITQLTALAQKPPAGLGISAVVSIIIALWSASSGMRWLLTALSMAYDEEESRKFVKLRGTALVLTVLAIVGMAVAIGLLVALPSIFRILGLGSTTKVVVSVLRWPVLVAVLLTGLSVLYRYGPDRGDPKWRWITPGSLIAAAVWLAASVGFSVYSAFFGKFDETYGAISAVIVLMLWLFLSAFAVLLGAEVNAELDRPRATDSTERRPRPMGARRANAA